MKIQDMIKSKTPQPKLGRAVKAAQEQLRSKHLVETVSVCGHNYTIRTLEPYEDDIAAGLVPDGGRLASGAQLPRATLAVALVAVDDVPVENEFALPDELDPVLRQIFDDPDVVKSWRREAIFEWLGQTGTELVDELWAHYRGLLLKRKEAVAGIGPLSSPPGTGA